MKILLRRRPRLPDRAALAVRSLHDRVPREARPVSIARLSGNDVERSRSNIGPRTERRPRHDTLTPSLSRLALASPRRSPSLRASRRRRLIRHGRSRIIVGNSGRRLDRYRGASDRVSGSRTGSASRSWSRTGPAATTTSAPRRPLRSPAGRLHAVHGQFGQHDQRDASTTSFHSTSSPTSRRSAASCARLLLMQVHPSVPAKTVPEFIAYAKANPGQDQHGLGRHGRHRHMSRASCSR